VAVVVPVYREELTADERISLKHLTRFLQNYPKYQMSPRSLRLRLEGFSVKRFDDRYFLNADTYSDLLLSKRFYQEFSDYEYILIYQLDALVFSDQLADWCAKGFDYIGAPWLRTSRTEFVTKPTVGNGGFSLRRIDRFLKVFESRNYAIDPGKYWQQLSRGRSKLGRFFQLPRKYLKRLRRFNGVTWETSRWAEKKSSPHPNEDYFWSFKATKYYPQFAIAPVEEALRFSFEVAPRKCFELNGRQLPFGCHGWAKYDREFWRPYLLD